jgi:dienelactone hydrolase
LACDILKSGGALNRLGKTFVWQGRGTMALRTLVLALTALFAATSAFAVTPDHVDIADGDLTLHATLYRPDGAGPFPAVVALHDCGGLSNRPLARSRLFVGWARLLVANGFVVLYPDSFGSRGLHSQCREHDRKIHASRERVIDANAARLWLQSQSYVRGDHISLLGWSNGGIAALWAVRRTAAAPAGSADFRSAVALYPGCQRLRQTAWSARVPTLILVGGADDWTPASTCQQMVAGAHGRSARVELVVYPGAQHEFDWINVPVRLHAGLVNTADPSGRAHTGSSPAARADAFKRVPEWLAK